MSGEGVRKGLERAEWVGASANNTSRGLRDDIGCRGRDLHNSSSEASDTRAWFVDWGWLRDV